MSTREQFLGGMKPPKVINNYWSGLGASTPVVQFDTGTTTGRSGKKYTPALTATTLTTLLSVTGSGMLDVLYFYENAAGAKTIRIKVTIDGTVAFDQTSPSVTNSASGAGGELVVGTVVPFWNGTLQLASVSAGQPVLFNSSLLIEVVSSTTDSNTDFIVGYRTN